MKPERNLSLRHHNKPLLALFLIVLIDVLGFTIIIPLVPFIAEKFGATPLMVGCLTASYAVCQLFSGPFLGSLSDQRGRRIVLLISQIGSAIGFLTMGLAPTLGWLFFGRILDGLTAGNYSVAQAYIADITEPKDRAKSFGLLGVAFGIGFMFGPAAAGFLAQWGFHVPMIVAAGLALTSFLGTYLFLPEPPERQTNLDSRKLSIFQFKKLKKWLTHPLVGIYFIDFFLFQLSFSMFFQGFPMFAERRVFWGDHLFGPAEVGYIYAFSGLIGVIVQGGLLRIWVRRFGEHRVALGGFLCMAIGYCMLVWVRNVEALLLAATMGSIGTSVLRPTITALISKPLQQNEQGIALGVTLSMTSFSLVLSPLIAGLWIEHDWIAGWALNATAIAILGFGLLWKVFQRLTIVEKYNFQVQK